MNTKRISKNLSLILRHQPEKINLKLDKNGWANVEELLKKLRINGKLISMEQLETVVATNDKQRFSFNEDKTKIRANQGHSIAIDLELIEQKPPEFLYHGTAKKFIDSILKKGLRKQNRHHVHLSSDVKTAHSVGKRHGSPIILKISAKQMFEQGFVFYQSKNGVWLTDKVPVEYIIKSS